MLKELKLIPVTEKSKPFIAAAERCNFDKIGYEEDEYFMYGTANIYQQTDTLHNTEIIYKDAPYCTRFLVRRPEDPAKFSGNVVIEILNATSLLDIDRLWINSWQYFTRHGDIYIGITSKGHVVDTLLNFDKERYADINWSNPMPDKSKEYPAFDAKNPSNRMKIRDEYEIGLFWDMMIDLRNLLKSDRDDNPLKNYKNKLLYLVGWSQSCGYVHRIINSFAYKPENMKGGPLFDGYMSAGVWSKCGPINNSDLWENRNPGIPDGYTVGAREPYMAVNTDSESYDMFIKTDIDEPNFKCHSWQITVSTHDSKYNLGDYYGSEFIDMIHSFGLPFGYDGPTEPMDIPNEIVYNAAFDALFQWVKTGKPAPHAPHAAMHISDKPCVDGCFPVHVEYDRDAFGNVLGGIRVPAANYPIARYTCGLFGNVYPFSAEFLTELYGSLDHYRQLIADDYDKLATQGFALMEEKEGYVEQCVKLAAARGLK